MIGLVDLLLDWMLHMTRSKYEHLEARSWLEWVAYTARREQENSPRGCFWYILLGYLADPISFAAPMQLWYDSTLVVQRLSTLNEYYAYLSLGILQYVHLEIRYRAMIWPG